MKPKSLPNKLIADHFVKHFQALRVCFPADIALCDYKFPVKLGKNFANQKVRFRSVVSLSRVGGVIGVQVLSWNLRYVDLQIEVLAGIFFQLE